MSKKVVRQFEEQFGKGWRCSCKAAFRPENLEILSESENSLLAHYLCPSCGREQMLAAAISEEAFEQYPRSDKMIKLPRTTITTDDILDIKASVRKMKFSNIRSFGNSRARRRYPALPRVSSSRD